MGSIGVYGFMGFMGSIGVHRVYGGPRALYVSIGSIGTV